MTIRAIEKTSFWRANALSLVVAAIFLATLAGQFFVGHAAWNDDRAESGVGPISAAEYATSGHFVGATFENWESEFLQMGMYILLTVWLRQRGSAESRPLDPAEEDPRVDPGPKPWPVRRGGVWFWVYSHSLSLAFLILFSLSFVLHACGSWRHELDVRSMHGFAPVTLPEHLAGAQFWFESLQNWQSEFLSVLAIVVLSIFLRERGSPESKPVLAPHSQTGG